MRKISQHSRPEKLYRSKRKNQIRDARRGRYRRLLALRKRVQNKFNMLVRRKNRNKKRLTVWMKIVRRVIWEARLPVAVALAWAAFRYPEAKMMSDSATHAAAAFTVALIIQGNFLRIAKNIRDEEHVKRTKGSFRQLEASIATIHSLTWSIYSALPRLNDARQKSVSLEPLAEGPAPSVSPAL